MALADIDDVSTHLPTDKFPGFVISDIGGQLASAERIIKGWLAGVYDPVTLASWANPAATPQLIRETAAKMAVAVLYRKSASTEVSDEDSNYAQRLYNEAMEVLRGLRTGELTLIDIGTGVVVNPSGQLGATSFYPNNGAPVPLMRMDLNF